MARAEKARHVATCETVTCRTCVHVHRCASARVCTCAYVCAHGCIIKVKAQLLRIFTNSLITRTLYTRIFLFIFAMRNFVSCFKCAGDMTA